LDTGRPKVSKKGRERKRGREREREKERKREREREKEGVIREREIEQQVGKKADFETPGIDSFLKINEATNSDCK
jgi:hypothetical protein